ncbi:MAG: helix-turn-helix domain-containing protein [Actinomycetota bacterium]|nr:helix-turn-helix domain-containing protein [Actinomycetota bacterium]
MELDVRSVAEILELSERRVRQLIDSGDLPARRAGGRFLVEEAQVPRSRPTTRPMSPRIATAFIDWISGYQPSGLSNSERSRLREKLQRLYATPEPADLLRSWLRRHDQVLALQVAARDVAAVREDPRFIPSGVSDDRSGLSAGHEAEGYVQSRDVADLRARYLMVERLPTNVWLHVVERPIPRPAPLGLVIADLARRDGPREDQRVLEMLRGLATKT